MKKPVYAIFGLGGIIGNALLKRLSDSRKVEDYRIFAFDHSRVDVMDPTHLFPVMEYVKPTIVFNCASISDPELCEDVKKGALNVNKGGAALISIACAQHRAKMVHFSTWGVFGGDTDKINNERTRAAPINVYGKTKLAGEQSVFERSKEALVIRAGWVFGEEGGPVGPWVDLAERRMRVQVRRDKVISPTYVNDLVDAALDLAGKRVKGVYHVANDDPVTMEEFARAVLSTCGLDENLVEALDDSRFKAPFPRNSALLCHKYRRAMRSSMRPWRDALKECLFNMNRYSP